jgi:hypothetical protein
MKVHCRQMVLLLLLLLLLLPTSVLLALHLHQQQLTHGSVTAAAPQAAGCGLSDPTAAKAS